MSDNRRFTGQRALRMTARTLHLCSVAAVVGYAMHRGDPGGWGALLVLSGLVIVGDDLYKYGADYFRYAQFWAVVVKLALVGIGLTWTAWLPASLFAAIVVGSVISHAPGTLRQWALWGEPGPCATRASKTPTEPHPA